MLQRAGGRAADVGTVPLACAEPCHVHKLRAKYVEMDLSDAKCLRQLEEENAKLKRLVADVILDNVVLKDLLGKPRRRRYNGGTRCCSR